MKSERKPKIGSLPFPTIVGNALNRKPEGMNLKRDYIFEIYELTGSCIENAIGKIKINLGKDELSKLKGIMDTKGNLAVREFFRNIIKEKLKDKLINKKWVFYEVK